MVPEVEFPFNDYAFYFGVWKPERLGHFLYDFRGENAERGLPKDFPLWRVPILDRGLLALGAKESDGKGQLCHIGGWTLFAFWDRTGDKRGGSNSVFIIKGRWSLSQVEAVARKRFPTIMARLDAAGVRLEEQVWD